MSVQILILPVRPRRYRRSRPRLRTQPRIARWMLRGRAEVHEVALSDACGRGTLYVPLSDQGVLLHLAGSLKRSHVQFRNIKSYDVEIGTLDEAGLGRAFRKGRR